MTRDTSEPSTKKERTHERIVAKASRLFRRDGFDGTSVGDLMRAAGLTHGGFYAHFRDKTALVSEALEAAFDQSERHLFAGALEGLEGEAWVEAAAGRYLAMSHRDQRAEGCAIPALGAETGRAPPRVRSVFARRVERVVDAIAERLGGASHRPDAWRLLATWVGALLLARAVPDRRLAAEILGTVRTSAKKS